MTTAREKGNLYRTRDPYALARSFFGFDPFMAFENRPAKANFTPTFEVKEYSDSYVLVADLPGVKEQDIEISLHNNVLTISGERRAEERKEGERYLVSERQYGQFARSFSLPDEADGEKVSANLSEGMLTVSIAKRAESQPRKISIKK